tara:strand:- start:160 stop:516 length:357 start_codon:yes stop_codon:yes gene_type:complete
MELRNFIKEEFTCDGKNCFKKMNPKLLKMLDDAREFADIPFTITSSWRSKAHNMEVGGEPNSAHLRGSAVDISCFSSYQRMLIVEALFDAGFTRIGIAKTFIHADCDIELPQEVLWMY